jgi:hypothetical protein
MLTPDKVAGELDYLDRPYSGGFERPYGWAWLLALHLEASRRQDAEWDEALAPLAYAFADRFKGFLPRLTYPIRTGTHFNTAFALILGLEWAEANDPELATLIPRGRPTIFQRTATAPPGNPEATSSSPPRLSKPCSCSACSA